jgi:hypothetical protein
VNKVALAMGCSWLAVQNPHDILSGGDCSDGEREGKSQLFESGHAENGSTARGSPPGYKSKFLLECSSMFQVRARCLLP